MLERKNFDSTVEVRYNDVMKFLEIENARDKIYYPDECGVQVHCRTIYRRARKGKRANVTVKAIRGKNFSVCAAINNESPFFITPSKKALIQVIFPAVSSNFSSISVTTLFQMRLLW